MTTAAINIYDRSSEDFYDELHYLLVPRELINQPRWLYWKYSRPTNGRKPPKIPYWSNNERRKGNLGGDDDLSKLVKFNDACEAFRHSPAIHIVNEQYGGVGFALIKEDGIRALDLDNCYYNRVITDSTAQQVFDQAKNDGCYIEVSPSGKGLRIIGYTSVDSVDFNREGKESYSRKRYVTITGDCIENTQGWGCVDNAHKLMDTLTKKDDSSALQNKNSYKPKVDLSTNIYAPLIENDENIALVQSALDSLDPDFKPNGKERDRDEWIKFVMSIQSLDWSSGKELARKWSERGNRFCAVSFETEWRSCKPDGGIKIGTLFHHAKNEGDWIDPRSKKNIEERELIVEKMNKRFAWIEEYSLIYRPDYNKFIKPQSLKEEFANRTVLEAIGNSSKKLSHADIWMKSPNRRQHTRIVMNPAQGGVTAENELNLWSGFNVKPAGGNVRQFLRLSNWLFPNKKERRYVLKWLAHLVQNPGIKMHVALVVWSTMQGVGKNLFFECIRSIIGDRHSTTIGKNELSSQFDGWAKNKIFVLGDEVLGADKRVDADRLKVFITGTTIQLNEKFQPAMEQENLLNFVFLSNHCNAVYIGNNDRRYFVVEVTADKLPTSDAKEFVAWKNNGGLEALLYFLQHLNLADFDPKAPAPLTESKNEMIADNKTELETWVASIMSAGPLNVFNREVVTSEELVEHYAQVFPFRHPPTTKATTNAFKGCNARSLKRQIPLRDGRRRRILVLANHDQWNSQPNSVLAEELAKPLLRKA